MSRGGAEGATQSSWLATGMSNTTGIGTEQQHVRHISTVANMMHIPATTTEIMITRTKASGIFDSTIFPLAVTLLHEVCPALLVNCPDGHRLQLPNKREELNHARTSGDILTSKVYFRTVRNESRVKGIETKIACEIRQH